MAQVPYLLGTAMDVYAWDEASIIPFQLLQIHQITLLISR